MLQGPPHPIAAAPPPSRRGPPSVGPDLVERPRLIGVLQRPSRLGLVVAPPGFGKSTVVAQWATTCPDPLAWVAADLLDEAPASFWRHVLDAVRSVVPSVDDEPRRALDEEPASNRFLNVLIAQLERAGGRSVLVLDSVPADVGRAVTDGLALITERVGDQLRLMMTMRVDPPLPLAHWRTKGWITEVREADLRFVDREALDVAATFDGLQLHDDVVRDVNERADGWPIALHLALVSAVGERDPEAWLRSIATTRSVLGDFVVAEILDHLPDAERSVVFDLSVVDWFDAELALDLAGDRAGPAIAELRRRRLLLTDVSEHLPGMRFHPLLRQLVAAELQWRDPQRYTALHRRAAELWRRRGAVMMAYRHLATIGDSDACHELVIMSLIAPGRRGAAVRDAAWASVAAAALDDAELAIALAVAAFINRDRALAHRWITHADELVHGGAPSVTGLRLHSVQALLALMEGRLDDAAAAAAAFEAQLGRSVGSSGLQARFATVAARIALQDLRTVDAARWRERLPAVAATPTDRLTAPVLHGWSALARGRPRDARAVLQPVCEWAERSGLRPHHVVVDAQVTAARAAIALGDLEAAEERATSACADAERLGWVWHRVRALGVAATVATLRGRPGDAIALIESGAAGLDRATELVEELTLVEATARHHAGDHVGAGATLAGLIGRAAVRVMQASIAFETDRPADVIALLEGSDVWGGEHRVQARTLLALTRRRSSELRTVLAEAAVVGWIGPFLMLGARARDHLRTLPLAQLHPALGAHLHPAGTQARVDGPELVEQLTARELSLLALLPTHLSYGGIAEQTRLSVNTVKSNLKAVYRKLAVTTRSEAVVKGRAAGLV